MIRRPPRSTPLYSSAASDVYKRQVWGIMNAFSGIATTGNASLATVAPGIAEALVATAAGLGAAIPSVIAYNYFLTRIRTIHTRIDSFTSEFINFLERKVDKG